jgi:tight adherence protein B
MAPFFTPLIYVLAFIAVVVLVQTLAGVFLSSGDRKRQINRRLTMLDSGLSPDHVYSSLVRRTAAPNFGGATVAALHERADLFCRQAGVAVTPTRLLAVAGAIAAVLWIIGLTFTHSAGGAGFLLNATVSLLAACGLSLFAVWTWMNRRRNARLKQIETQLPLALDVVNRAIRAGHPVISAVKLAALEMSDPIGSEFGLIVDETTYGAEFKDALENFARRTGSRDAGFFAVAVGIQSETGGNLAEILEGLASVIRGRGTLALRVKSLASEGKASAYLLSALPVILISVQMVTNPSFYTSKVHDPIFWPIAGSIITLYLIGWVTVNRIINFKY